jgi:UDP-glucose 4-epimerase
VNDTQPQRILVTGAAGFIGSHVVDRLLDDGYTVFCVDDLSTGRERNLSRALDAGARIETLDVRTEDFRSFLRAASPDAVMHLAGQPEVRRSVRDPIEDASQNVLGTLSVYEAARAAGTHRVIIASSGGTIYGETRGQPVAEDSATHPISPYGISKRVLEDYAAFYKVSAGISTLLLGIGNAYGPRQHPRGEAGVVSIFLGSMIRGEQPVIIGDGSMVRDYVYVADVADAFARSLTSPAEGVVNVGTGRGTTVLDLFRACARAVGYEGEPAFQAGGPGEVKTIVLSVERAARDLDWRPSTSLESGLRETASYLANGG